MCLCVCLCVRACVCVYYKILLFMLYLLVPPVVSAVRSIYTSTVGSNIILRCHINNTGVPLAEFSWKKTRNIMYNKFYMLINNSVMEMYLMNLTYDSEGVYTCAANGLLSYDSDSVELRIVESKPMHSYINVVNLVIQ